MTADAQATSHTKAQIRARIRAMRNQLDTSEMADRDAARTGRIVSALKKLSCEVIACYVSREPEPDTLELLTDLADQGVGILLPWLGPDLSQVSWAWWAGEEMVDGPFGIPIPTAPRMGPDVLSQADVIIVPGLAGTRSGIRLGQGGGWYDRALPHARPGAPRWMLLNDSEVLDDLPCDPHDQRVTALVTEHHWISCG